jgi:hypothetical protein
MPAPNWLSGMVLPEPERGPRGERVVPYEAVTQAVAMADAALKEKTRTAQRSALAAASLGFQKGVAATQAAMAQQARVLMRLMRLRGRIASRSAEGAARRAFWALRRKRSAALLTRYLGRAFRASLAAAGALLAWAPPAPRCFAPAPRCPPLQPCTSEA